MEDAATTMIQAFVMSRDVPDSTFARFQIPDFTGFQIPDFVLVSTVKYIVM